MSPDDFSHILPGRRRLQLEAYEAQIITICLKPTDAILCYSYIVKHNLSIQTGIKFCGSELLVDETYMERLDEEIFEPLGIDLLTSEQFEKVSRAIAKIRSRNHA